MKKLFENWNKYLTEEIMDDEQLAKLDNAYPLDLPDQVQLYHVSSTPDIEVLDPQIAAAGRKTYSQAEYRAWDRPRVFYFTRLGQEDTGIGRIQGSAYTVTVNKHDLYPVMKDPLGLSRRVDEYKEIREKEFGTPRYYPTNVFERVATLGEREYGFKGFIYPQSKDPNQVIVAIWQPLPATPLDVDFYGD